MGFLVLVWKTEEEHFPAHCFANLDAHGAIALNMMMLSRTVLLLVAICCVACQSTTIVPDNERPDTKANLENVMAFAELQLELIPNELNPSNPFFEVTISNTSTGEGAGDLHEHAFTISMYDPPIYATLGNLVVWRDGERLWDVEPLQFIMMTQGLPATQRVLIYPYTGYVFRFSADMQFPLEKAPEVPDPPKVPSGSVGDLLFLHLPKDPPAVNPFLTPGKYKIRYEILLPSEEGQEDRRLLSNEVFLVIDPQPQPTGKL